MIPCERHMECAYYFDFCRMCLDKACQLNELETLEKHWFFRPRDYPLVSRFPTPHFHSMTLENGLALKHASHVALQNHAPSQRLS